MKRFKIRFTGSFSLMLSLLFAFFISSCLMPVESIEYEEKIYWTGSIDEDFDGSTVLIVMDKNVGGVNKVHKKSFFRGVEIEEIHDLTIITGDIHSALINWEHWHQILSLKLPGDSKKNVVNAIRKLEKIKGILSAEPNYYIYLDDAKL